MNLLMVFLLLIGNSDRDSGLIFINRFFFVWLFLLIGLDFLIRAVAIFLSIIILLYLIFKDVSPFAIQLGLLIRSYRHSRCSLHFRCYTDRFCLTACSLPPEMLDPRRFRPTIPLSWDDDRIVVLADFHLEAKKLLSTYLLFLYLVTH